MDKKRIDIDDLVRQRLSDREVPMPPGAWNKMSGLLDQHLPVQAASVGRRRWLGLLLLLGTLGGSAGYALMHRETSLPAELAVFTPAKSTASDAYASNASNTIGTAEASAGNTAGLALERTPVTTPAASVPARKSLSPAAAKTTPSASVAQSANPVPAPLGTAKTSSGTTILATPVEAVRRETTVALPLPAAPATASPVPAPLYAVMPVASKPVSYSPPAAAATALNARRLNSLLIGAEALRALNRQNQYTFSTEGLSARKARKALKIWNKTRPANSPGQTAVAIAAPPASVPPVVAAANSPAGAATQSALLVPLSNFKVASRKSNAYLPTSSEKLVNVVENMKQTAAQTKFYAGMMAGINSSLTGVGSLQGFHFGLMGMIAFSEHFALVAELRYLRRFNGSANLRDDYYNTKRISESAYTQNGQTYNVYRYDLDSNVSFYKFGSLNTFQLPLYMRYSRNRLSLLAGVHLAYHLRTDVEHGGDRIATISRYDTLLAAATPVAPLSRQATVSVADFGRRFGIGYVAGAGYELSPAINLDLRLSQQIWDNLKGTSEGARTVSKNYFQLPTLQLSVGYRFQQRAAQSRR